MMRWCRGAKLWSLRRFGVWGVVCGAAVGIAGATLGAALVLGAGSASPAAGGPTKPGLDSLIIFHTNDTHAHLMPFQNEKGELVGGAAARAALLKRERDRAPLADARRGRRVQGTPFFNFFHGVLSRDEDDEVRRRRTGNHDLTRDRDVARRREHRDSQRHPHRDGGWTRVYGAEVQRARGSSGGTVPDSLRSIFWPIRACSLANGEADVPGLSHDGGHHPHRVAAPQRGRRRGRSRRGGSLGNSLPEASTVRKGEPGSGHLHFSPRPRGRQGAGEARFGNRRHRGRAFAYQARDTDPDPERHANSYHGTVIVRAARTANTSGGSRSTWTRGGRSRIRAG